MIGSGFSIWIAATSGAGGAQQHERTVNDSLGVSDALSMVRTVSRVIAESLGITDAHVQEHGAIRTIDNAIGLTDAKTFGQSAARTINNAMGLTDSRVVLAPSVPSSMIYDYRVRVG